MTVYCIVSCVMGEPTEPREVDGETEWKSRQVADQMLNRYCDENGLDPDDFTISRREASR
jgi:hypothetical protein